MSQYTVYHVTNQQQLDDAYIVRKRVFVEEQKVDPAIEIDEHEGSCEHFVLYRNEQPIGAGRLRPLSEILGKVERICVDQAYRGLGLGEKIMEAVEKRAIDIGLNRVKLHAQAHAKSFYEKIGYTITSEPFTEAGIIHVRMEKEL